MGLEDLSHTRPTCLPYRSHGTLGLMRTGTSVHILKKERCCLRVDNKMPYRDLDPNSLYDPVARHETIGILLAGVAPQDLFFECADISNAYLCGHLDQPEKCMKQRNRPGNRRSPTMLPWSISFFTATGQMEKWEILFKGASQLGVSSSHIMTKEFASCSLNYPTVS